jgi:hypothetical protein
LDIVGSMAREESMTKEVIKKGVADEGKGRKEKG